MPRGPTGTYSLPELPFIPETPALAAEVNSDLSDIAAVLTASLDRYGNGGMLAPLRGVDGTLAAPAVAFTAETGTGMRRAGAGDLRFGVAGADVLRLTAALARIESALTVLNGNLEANAGAFSGALTAFSSDMTGLAKSGSLQVTGAATIGTTLGVTGIATFTAGADMTGDKVVNLGTPTSATDAATKGYVDTTDASLQNQITAEVARGHGAASFSASDVNLPTSATRYLPSGWAAALTTDVAFWVTPAAGTIRDFRAWANTAAGGASTVFTVMVNGVASAVTATLASAANSASDLVNTVAVAAGDRVSLRAAVGGGASGPGLISTSMRFLAS